MTNTYTVDLSNWIFLTFFLGTILCSMFSNALDWLNSEKGNITEKMKRLHSLNPLLKKYFSRNRINKAIKYNEDNDKFSDLIDSIESGAMTTAILLGLIPMSLDFLLNNGFSITSSLITISISATLISTAISIPFTMYHTFVIEERNGFNRMSKSTFFKDIVKSFVIGCSLNSIFIFIGNLVFTNFRFTYSNAIYLILGLVTLTFMMELLSFTMMKAFNKFTPLKDKTLLGKLKKVFSNAGYSVKNILVMDGSKRSTHSNAFVCGFGKAKKIVLFDTLLKKFTSDEITSILAHEIGHAKKRHLLFRRAFGIVGIASFIIIAISFLYDTDIYHAFGFSYVTEDNVQTFSLIGLTLVTMVLKPIRTILIDPLEAFLSRKMEYQADSEAKTYVKTGKHLASSLIKLTSENLSDPFPNTIVESVAYDHPSLINRLRNLGEIKEVRQKLMKNTKQRKEKKSNAER